MRTQVRTALSVTGYKRHAPVWPASASCPSLHEREDRAHESNAAERQRGRVQTTRRCRVRRGVIGAPEYETAGDCENGKVLQELVIEKDDAVVIETNVIGQRREIERSKSVPYPRILMRLHQSSVEDLRLGKRTSEKGIVECIDMTPRKLIYASDLAGQRIKEEIMKPDGNPFQKGFVIDLDVETVGGKPRVYRVIEVYDIIDLDED